MITDVLFVSINLIVPLHNTIGSNIVTVIQCNYNRISETIYILAKSVRSKTVSKLTYGSSMEMSLSGGYQTKNWLI